MNLSIIAEIQNNVMIKNIYSILTLETSQKVHSELEKNLFFAMI